MIPLCVILTGKSISVIILLIKVIFKVKRPVSRSDLCKYVFSLINENRNMCNASFGSDFDFIICF